jgi:hypothetical protein
MGKDQSEDSRSVIRPRSAGRVSGGTTVEPGPVS